MQFVGFKVATAIAQIRILVRTAAVAVRFTDLDVDAEATVCSRGAAEAAAAIRAAAPGKAGVEVGADRGTAATATDPCRAATTAGLRRGAGTAETAAAVAAAVPATGAVGDTGCRPGCGTWNR